MGRTIRQIVADNILEHYKKKTIHGYRDKTELEEYTVLEDNSSKIEVEIRKANNKHFITVTKVIGSTRVAFVNTRKTEKYEWYTKSNSKEITTDIINVINELL